MAEFKFSCPQCSQHIQCDTSYAGMQINCPVCQKLIVVPQPPHAVAAMPTSQIWRKVLVIAISMVVLAGLGWFGYLIYEHGHLPPGSVGLWSGEGSGKNSVGGSIATLTDVTIKKSEMGQAFSFDETNSGIKILATKPLNVGRGKGFTIMAWIKPSDLSQRNEIFEWDNAAPGQIVTWGVHMQMLKPQEFGLGAGNLYASVHDTDGREHMVMARGGTITANVFQHVALSYDKTSGIARLFCNGKIVAEQKIGQVTPQTSYDFYIGRRPAGDGLHSFSGLIAKAGVFNRALSTSEIQAIYLEKK
jgi:hypothetical protein